VPLPREPPDRGKLERLIHSLAEDGAFSLKSQAFDKCQEKGIDIHDVLRVLAVGTLSGPIEPGIEPGEWKCKMVGKPDRSRRMLSVVTIVIKDLHLFLTEVDCKSQ
jgi:hypothetical protein